MTQAWTNANACKVCICWNRNITRLHRQNGKGEFFARFANQCPISRSSPRTMSFNCLYFQRGPCARAMPVKLADSIALNEPFPYDFNRRPSGSKNACRTTVAG